MECVAGTYEAQIVGVKFDAETGNPDLTFGYSPHVGCVKTVAVSPNGRIMVSGSTDEAIRVYDLRRRIEIGVLTQHNGAINCATFHESSGKTHMLTCSEDKTIAIWRTHDWACMKVMTGHKKGVRGLAIHPSGAAALSASADSTVKLWDLTKGKCSGSMKVSQPEGDLGAISWLNDGKYYAILGQQESSQLFAAGGEDKIVSIWDLRAPEAVMTLPAHDRRIKAVGALPMPRQGHAQADDSGDASDDMGYGVFSASSDGSVRLVDLRNHTHVFGNQKTSSRLTCLAVIPSASSRDKSKNKSTDEGAAGEEANDDDDGSDVAMGHGDDEGDEDSNEDVDAMDSASDDDDGNEDDSADESSQEDVPAPPVKKPNVPQKSQQKKKDAKAKADLNTPKKSILKSQGKFSTPPNSKQQGHGHGQNKKRIKEGTNPSKSPSSQKSNNRPGSSDGGKSNRTLVENEHENIVLMNKRNSC